MGGHLKTISSRFFYFLALMVLVLSFRAHLIQLVIYIHLSHYLVHIYLSNGPAQDGKGWVCFVHHYDHRV